jgi:hypothetical protein
MAPKVIFPLNKNAYDMAKCFTDRIYPDCILIIKTVSKPSNIKQQHFLRSKKPHGKMQSINGVLQIFVHFSSAYLFIFKLIMNSSSSMPAVECLYEGGFFYLLCDNNVIVEDANEAEYCDNDHLFEDGDHFSFDPVEHTDSTCSRLFCNHLSAL